MEYLYAALLLHKAGKPINEENVKKILETAGITPNEARVKALVAALEGVNIEEVISAAAPVAATPAAPAAKPEEKKPKKEEKKPTEEEAAAGLVQLFA
jgi:large subunit ribosomal protein L12